MKGWWTRNPFFMSYMVREATALAVWLYSVELLAGAVCLLMGEGAWNAWLATMRHPIMIVINLVVLWSMVIHAKSWFDIMPKTMPMIFISGRRLEASTITRVGYTAVVVVTLVILGLALWGRS
jgi:fumarate reductase subunit C